MSNHKFYEYAYFVSEEEEIPLLCFDYVPSYISKIRIVKHKNRPNYVKNIAYTLSNQADHMDKKRKHKMEMNAKARRKARHKKSSK
jgi:hypothetical protein